MFSHRLRMKLSARGGHTCRTNSVLFVAAAGRSLCAVRWAPEKAVSVDVVYRGR
jgi:hypothetical protein